MSSTEAVAPHLIAAHDDLRRTLHPYAGTADMPPDARRRYWNAHYHLLRGAHRDHLRAAAHESLRPRPALRQVLTEIGAREESEELRVGRQLLDDGNLLGAIPIDAALWHAYLRSRVDQEPFLQIGAAVAFGRLRGTAHELDLLRALDPAELDAWELEGLVIGARTAALQYVRLIGSALHEASIELPFAGRKAAILEIALSCHPKPVFGA